MNEEKNGVHPDPKGLGYLKMQIGSCLNIHTKDEDYAVSAGDAEKAMAEIGGRAPLKPESERSALPCRLTLLKFAKWYEQNQIGYVPSHMPS